MRMLSGRRPNQQRATETEEQKRQREEEDLQREIEQSERLLPWTLDQKVACLLNPIKVPIVILVGILGTYLELKLSGQTLATYEAGLMDHWPTCVVHRVNTNLKFNHSMLGHAASSMESIFAPINNWTKTKLEGDWNCSQKEGGNETKCVVFDTGIGLNFTKDYCVLAPDCSVPEHLVDEHAGLKGAFGFMPMALLWAVYKLVFLPVHVVDRFYNRLVGYPQPLPEPTFKLLSEPVMSNQNVNKVFEPVAKIIKVIRYMMLPNALILPFMTMRSRKHCENHLVYDVDTKIGWGIYFWVLCDLFMVVTLYVLGKTVCGKCIGTWKYRWYKFWWLSTTGIPIILFIADLLIVLNWKFWKGIVFIFRLVFTFSWTFDFTVNVVQWLATINGMLDLLSLVILIASILCPVLLRQTCPALEEDDDTEGGGIPLSGGLQRAMASGPMVITQGAAGRSSRSVGSRQTAGSADEPGSPTTTQTELASQARPLLGGGTGAKKG